MLMDQKAFEIYNHYQIPVISDDSGLFVNSLNGMPGLRSKRYAGENASDIENIEKLLTNLSEKKDRSAHFQTVLYFYDGKTEITTEGILEGVITTTVHCDHLIQAYEGANSDLQVANKTHKEVFDIKDDDIYWCAADCGWVTGHSYIVY